MIYLHSTLIRFDWAYIAHLIPRITPLDAFIKTYKGMLPNMNMNNNQTITLNKEQFLNALLIKYKGPALEELLYLYRAGAVQNENALNILLRYI